ncbi:hypothetical protein AX15_005650 [Amanita polypyramis BW_CC]|nr:hypothetical protein AX15_005650 [Amanita polypyramis BW_CC]
MSFESHLADLPLEILLENILPILPTSDLLNLGCTNRSLAKLCNDETLWHNKLLVDFNFTGAGTARSSNWKLIYKGLDKPKVYVWGDRRDGRLGLTKYPSTQTYAVPFPTRLKLPGVRVVSLVAGGWSFHALDSAGNIHVWGTLNSERSALRNEGFSESGKTAYVPKRLSLPTSFRIISCGRSHSSALDSSNKIWTFINWGRPIRMTCPVFNDRDFTPVQVECGWMFSCVLVRSGDVFAWFPFSGTLENRIVRNNHEMNRDENTFALERDGVIPCAPWDTDLTPERLPSLPPLPELGETTAGNGTEQETKLVKIAGFDGHIIGLTNRGHVVKFRGLDNEQTVAQGQWTYLPKFSEASALREHSIFVDPKSELEAPKSLRITHVSANFTSFVAYSTGSNSVVLMGDTDTTEESEPRIIPDLQNKSVISVVLGDYHSAALAADGKLYTWGKFSAGALGLGEEPVLSRSSNVFDLEELTINVPTEVWFGRRKNRFCIAVAAAGWHTGALVIDLEPGGDESDEEAENAEPEPTLHPYSNRNRQGHPFVPLPNIFRVGFAGRYRRGQSRGRGSLGQ